MRTRWLPLLLVCLGLLAAGGSWDSAALAQCVIAPPAPASTQTRARVGAYYFDGWAGPLAARFDGERHGAFRNADEDLVDPEITDLTKY